MDMQSGVGQLYHTLLTKLECWECTVDISAKEWKAHGQGLAVLAKRDRIELQSAQVSTTHTLGVIGRSPLAVRERQARIAAIFTRSQGELCERRHEEIQNQKLWEESEDCAVALARLTYGAKHGSGAKITTKDVNFVHKHADGSGGWRMPAQKGDGEVMAIYGSLHEANSALKASVRRHTGGGSGMGSED